MNQKHCYRKLPFFLTLRYRLPAILLCLIVLAPCSLRAADTPAGDPLPESPGPEWFAIQLGGGPYFAALRLDLCTLRRNALFWTLFHMRANGFVDTGYMEFGNAAGAVLTISKRTEFRAGLGVAYSLYLDGKQYWSGLGITPQLGLTWGKRRHFMWELTAALHVPVVGKHGTKPGYESLLDHPMDTPPVFTLCIGLRI